ncbi:MAG: hypothetical protein FWG00_02675 [Coriobacteriia bacterium]|nr:hypothetical protein [Coriobacteriia bacterium]
MSKYPYILTIPWGVIYFVQMWMSSGTAIRIAKKSGGDRIMYLACWFLMEIASIVPGLGIYLWYRYRNEEQEQEEAEQTSIIQE